MALRKTRDNPLGMKPVQFAELEHLEETVKWCRDFRTAIDGGANVGGWSITLAKTFQRVHAFEPDPGNFKTLSWNCGPPNADMPVKDWDGEIIVHEAALGPEAGKSYLAGKSSTSMHLARGMAKHYLERERGTVDVMTIDSLGIDDLDLLKLDLEGYELWALQGARETIEKCRPVIIIENIPKYERRFGGPGRGAFNFLQNEIAVPYYEVARFWPNHILVPPGAERRE